MFKKLKRKNKGMKNENMNSKDTAKKSRKAKSKKTKKEAICKRAQITKAQTQTKTKRVKKRSKAFEKAKDCLIIFLVVIPGVALSNAVEAFGKSFDKNKFKDTMEKENKKLIPKIEDMINTVFKKGK